MNEPPVREGEVLAGKYRVERVLGVGGMGVVVAATHLQLEERVALKFLVKDALENADAVARFAREARAAVKIKSEHVARVIDVGTMENGAPYMVMEYLEGCDLAQVLQSRGPLSVEDAVEYVLQACEAIAHAHVLGIVHRDLKPANLFLIRRPDGTDAIKVLDFGISKVMPGKGSSSDNAMTRTRAIMGSPLYMSPEQMTSTRDVDGRTDIWSLGIILYELLAGQSPFTADSLPLLCGLILSAPTPSIQTVRPGIPPGLDAVLRRALEKDPARRYGNIAEFAGALAEFAPARARVSVERVARVVEAAGLTTSAAVVRVPAEGRAQTVDAWTETNLRAQGKPSKKTLWVGLVAAGFLLVAVVLIAHREQGAVKAGALVLPASLASAAPNSVQSAPLEVTTPAPTAPTASVPTAEPTPAGTAVLRSPLKRPPVAASAHKGPAAPPPAPPPAKTPSDDLFDDRK
jgi:serine/threonine-protein kinase